jgi:hypothetical protein
LIDPVFAGNKWDVYVNLHSYSYPAASQTDLEYIIQNPTHQGNILNGYAYHKDYAAVDQSNIRHRQTIKIYNYNGTGSNFEIYAPEQEPDYRMWPTAVRHTFQNITATVGLGAEDPDITNRQAFETRGYATGGQLTPPTAHADPKVTNGKLLEIPPLADASANHKGGR